MSNQIEYRHYRYFLALAKDLHFRKAAERLYISQPGLSRQIKQMEETMGVQLFNRHNRKVELTVAGKYLKDELTSHFERLDAIITHTKLINDGIEGKLKLGFVGSAMQKAIPELLLRFKKQHPNVLFSLNEMDNGEQIQSLLKQDIDIGFVRMERVPRGLSIMSVLEDSFSLVLPKNHLIDKHNFIDLSQFKDESFILFNSSYSISYYEKVMQIFDDSGFTPLTSHYTVNASSIFRLVENNVGISIVPSSLKLGYDMKIKFIELTKIKQHTTLKAVWNNSSRNPLLENFVQKVREFSEGK